MPGMLRVSFQVVSPRRGRSRVFGRVSKCSETLEDRHFSKFISALGVMHRLSPHRQFDIRGGPRASQIVAAFNTAPGSALRANRAGTSRSVVAGTSITTMTARAGPSGGLATQHPITRFS